MTNDTKTPHRERAEALVKIMVEQGMVLGGEKDQERVVVMVERTLAATDPKVAMEARRLRALEGIAVSLHVVSGLMGIGAVRRNEITMEHYQSLIAQALEAYAGVKPQAPQPKPGNPSDLPPGVLG